MVTCLSAEAVDYCSQWCCSFIIRVSTPTRSWGCLLRQCEDKQNMLQCCYCSVERLPIKEPCHLAYCQQVLSRGGQQVKLIRAPGRQTTHSLMRTLLLGIITFEMCVVWRWCQCNRMMGRKGTAVVAWYSESTTVELGLSILEKFFRSTAVVVLCNIASLFCPIV